MSQIIDNCVGDGLTRLQVAIKGRRSVRKYKPQLVSDDTIRLLLEAAVWAPYAGETWEFIVVKSYDKRKELSAAVEKYPYIAEAPVDIIVCSKLRGASARDRVLYSIQETGAAIQNLMLTAYEHNLGTCWIGDFNEAVVKRILHIPREVKVFAIITVGYKAEEPSPPKRKPLSKIVHWEKY